MTCVVLLAIGAPAAAQTPDAAPSGSGPAPDPAPQAAPAPQSPAPAEAAPPPASNPAPVTEPAPAPAAEPAPAPAPAAEPAAKPKRRPSARGERTRRQRLAANRTPARTDRRHLPTIGAGVIPATVSPPRLVVRPGTPLASTEARLAALALLIAAAGCLGLIGHLRRGEVA